MSEKTKYIVFTASVTAQTISKLREAAVGAANARFTELYILISSNGGDVNEGLNIAALLRSLPPKIVMHNIGQTDSVSNVIFAAGHTPYAPTNASIPFHRGMVNLTQLHMM